MILVGDLSSVLLFAATFLAVYVVYRSRSNRKYPPSLPWLPVVGSLPFMGDVNKIPRMFMEKAASIGNVFSFYAASECIIVINGREAIYDALVTKSTDFADRHVRFLFRHYNLKKDSAGILSRQYNTEFKKLQQQILSVLKEFGFGKRTMESRIAVEVSQLVEFATSKRGEAFDYRSIFTASVMNIIHAIFFGSRRDPADPTLVNLIRLVDATFTCHVPVIDFFPILRFVPGFKKRLTNEVSVLKEVNEFIANCISSADPVQESFVNNFVTIGGDPGELLGVLRDLMLAGSETTTTTLLWSLVMLANHPEIQDRIHKEIDAFVPRDRFPTLDDRPKLPFVEASLLELMRWKTLIPLALPHKTHCDTESGGYVIPKDTRVVVNLYSVHMDPKVWKDPSVFRPERFLDDGGHTAGKHLIIPFSLGKRSCLGEQLARQELFLFFTGLLQHFAIRPPEGQDIINTTENFGVTMFPSPFMVRLISRRDKTEPVLY